MLVWICVRGVQNPVRETRVILSAPFTRGEACEISGPDTASPNAVMHPSRILLGATVKFHSHRFPLQSLYSSEQACIRPRRICGHLRPQMWDTETASCSLYFVLLYCRGSSVCYLTVRIRSRCSCVPFTLNKSILRCIVVSLRIADYGPIANTVWRTFDTIVSSHTTLHSVNVEGIRAETLYSKNRPSTQLSPEVTWLDIV